MATGDTLRISDIEVPEGVKLLDDSETVVATVTAPTRVIEPEEEEVEGEEGEAVEGEAAEGAEAEGGAESPAEPGADDAAGDQGTTES
jgi:large subunit ribosomal protein L25